MSVEVKVTLSNGREFKLNYSEVVELRNTLNQFSETFQRGSESMSEQTSLMTHLPVKPTYQSVMQYIRNKPRYEHSLVELEHVFYGRRLAPSSPEWESLYHQARNSRIAISKEEKFDWETLRGEKNGDGKRAPRIYRKLGA
jgi:hypothetical protein